MTTLPQTAPVRMPRPAVPTQLAMHSPPPTALAAHGGPGSGAAGGLTAQDMWRIIRGNIWLILITVLVAGVAGYLVNSYLARNYSQYTARGYVLVRGQGELPRPGIEIREPQPSEIELLQNTQTAMLTHETLFMEAIQNPESRIRRTKWFQKFGQQNLDLAKEDLAKKFRVTPRPGSKLIQVEMTFSDPEDSKVIVEDMVFEHIKNVKAAQVKQDQEKVKLLGRELAMIKLELDNEVGTQILLKEKDLGADEVATFTIYNGKQIQLDRLGQERSKIAGELSGFEARLNTLVRDLEEGRTPAEVEREINHTGRYIVARQQVDEVDISIEQLSRKFGPQHDQVISRKQLRQTLQAKVDEIREELKSNYSETMKNGLKNDRDATQANAQRVERLMDDVSKQLADLNQKMSEYKTLKEREKELRERVRDLNQEMTKINQFHINAPWASAEWGSRPQKPDRPSFPKLAYTMGVAIALGLALSLGIAFLREMTDTTVRSPRDIARVGQMNLLGMIPHDADDPQSSGARLPLVIFDAPHSIEAEAFRQVRTRLQHSASLDTVRSILVTSPSTGDGKTTVACNLAAGLAQNGRRILLVDANFRKPQLHSVFGLPNDIGLSDALQDPDGLGTFVRETEVPNLSVMTSGPKPANGTELLESQLQIDFIDRALEEFDHVIFDSGPLLMVADSIALAPRVDGVVTVVRARGNSRGLLMRMRDELKTLKAEHLGVILNAVRAQGGGYYGRNIQAYYRYQNEE